MWYSALSYFRPGVVYPRTRVRDPYPDPGRGAALRRAELLADLGPPGPEPGTGTPGGSWRRPGWSWARVWRRPAASWGRVWRYRPVSATRIPPAALSKPASEPRWFAVSLAEAPEVVAGETLSAPELLPGGGPAGLTISGLIVLDAVFDRIPIGRGVKFFVAGGTANAIYNFAVRVTTSGGSKPVVPCRLVVTPDYDSE